jgi:hypothetical protein
MECECAEWVWATEVMCIYNLLKTIEMAKFKYGMVASAALLSEEYLDKMGSEGKELVSILKTGGVYLYIFKTTIEDDGAAFEKRIAETVIRVLSHIAEG